MPTVKDLLGRGEGRKPGWTYAYQLSIGATVVGLISVVSGNLVGLLVAVLGVAVALYTFPRYRER